MNRKDLICLADLNIDEINEILDVSVKLKKNNDPNILKGKVLGLIFKKSSTRTRVSFEVAIHQLGGYSIFLRTQDVQIGRGETIADTAKVLSRYINGVVIRTYEHNDIVEFFENSSIPVINGLSDFSHPCQVLCDLMTIKEKKGKLDGVKVAFVGDGSSNMATSWIFGAVKTGVELVIASPKGYQPDKGVLEIADGFTDKAGSYSIIEDPCEAVKNADIIYSDVWVSMGQEDQKDARIRALTPYQVNADLLKKANKDCLVMHCLPAHRGEEITDDVIDGEMSVVFDQAENRLHVQKGILALLMK